MTMERGGVQATKDGLQLGGFEVLFPGKITSSGCWGVSLARSRERKPLTGQWLQGPSHT